MRWPALDEVILPLTSGGIVWRQSGADDVCGLPQCPHRFGQRHRHRGALVIGLGSYMSWKYIAGVLLALHLLNSYIYFGRHPFWGYVNAEARTLLWPLRAVPLRVGKVDFCAGRGNWSWYFCSQNSPSAV